MITEEQKHQVKYFIKKLEVIPEERWCKVLDDGKGNHCVLGHLGNTQSAPSEEGILFKDLLNKQAVNINDGNHPNYQQPTPKQRILAALHDLLKI